MNQFTHEPQLQDEDNEEMQQKSSAFKYENKQTPIYQPLPPSRDTTALVVGPAQRPQNNNQQNSPNENSQQSGNIKDSTHSSITSRGNNSNSVSADLNGNKMTPVSRQADDDNNSNGFMYMNRRHTLPPATRFDFLEAHLNNNNAKIYNRVGNDGDDGKDELERPANPPNQEQQQEDHTPSKHQIPVVDRSLFKSAFVASVAPVPGAYLEQISTTVIRNVCRKLLQVSVKPLFTGETDSATNNNNNNKKKDFSRSNEMKKHPPLHDPSPGENGAQQSKRQISPTNNNNNNTLNAVKGKMQSETKNQDERMPNKFATCASALRLNTTVERLARVLTMIPKNWILVTSAAASSMTTVQQQQHQQHLHSLIHHDSNNNINIHHQAKSASVLLTSALPSKNNSSVVVKEEPVVEAKILTVTTSTLNTSVTTMSRLFAPQDDELPTTATCGLAGLRDLLKARSLRFLNNNEIGKKNINSYGSMIASVVSLPGMPLLPLVDELSASCNNKTPPLGDESTKEQDLPQLKRPNNATTLAVDDIHLKEFVELGSPTGLTSFLAASPSVFDLSDAAMKDYLHTARYPGTFRPVATLGAGAFGTAYLVVYKEKQDVIEKQTKDLEFRSSHAITEEFYLSSTVFSSPKEQNQHTNSSLSQKATTGDLIFGSLNNKIIDQNSVADKLITAFENDGTGKKNDDNDNIDAKRFANFLKEATPTNQPPKKPPRKNASNVSFLVDQREESALTNTADVSADGRTNSALQVSNIHSSSNLNCSNSDTVVEMPSWVLPPGRISLVRRTAPLARVSPSEKRNNNDNSSNNVDDVIIPPPRVTNEDTKSRSVNMVSRNSPSSLRFGSGVKNNINNINRRERQHPDWKARNPLMKKSIVPVGGPAGYVSGMSCTTANVTVTMTKDTSPPKTSAAAATEAHQNTDNNYSVSRVLAIPREQIFVCKVEKLPDAQSLKRKKMANDIKSKMPWDSDIHIVPSDDDEDDGDQKNNSEKHPLSVAAEIAKKRLERMQNEAHILSNIAHPNIVGYVDYFFDKKANRQLLFLEYVDGGDLFKEIERRRNSVPKLYFSLETILHVFVQVVLAVEYLHRHNILHRDIKSHNILLSKFLFVKLTDFGTAKQFDQDVDQNVECGIAGSPLFMCAARLNGEYYSQKSEMWSLGVLLYELLSFEYPFMSNDIKELTAMIQEDEPRPFRRQGERVPVELFRLLESLLRKHPDDRPTAKEVLTQNPMIAKAVLGYENRLQKFAESADESTPADKAWLGVLKDHIRAVYEDHPISMSSQRSRADDSAIRGDLSRMRSGSGAASRNARNVASVVRGEQRYQTSAQSSEKHSVSASGKILVHKNKPDGARNNNNNNTISNNDTSNDYNNNSHEDYVQTPRRPILMQVLQPVRSSEGWSGSRTPSPQGNKNNNNNNDAMNDFGKADHPSSPVSLSSSPRLVSMILARRGNDDDDDATDHRIKF